MCSGMSWHCCLFVLQYAVAAAAVPVAPQQRPHPLPHLIAAPGVGRGDENPAPAFGDPSEGDVPPWAAQPRMREVLAPHDATLCVPHLLHSRALAGRWQ